MSKPAAIFVAAAMAVTAGCVSVIASYGLSLGIGQSALAGVGALAVMAVTHLAFLRAAPRDDERLEDIDRVVTDLQSRLEIIELRLQTLDGAIGERARAATKPLVDEIAALGGLVTTIAKEVAAHDVAISKLKAPKVEHLSDRVAAPPQPPVFAPEPAAAPAPQPAAPRPAPAKMRAPEPFDPGASDTALDPDLALRIDRALAEDRIEPHLQPIVSLPSRRTAHYEAFSRLVESDGVLTARQFVGVAGAHGRLADLDRRILERSAAVALRVSARGGGSLFVNVSPDTLREPSARAAMTALFDGRKELSRLIVLEMAQSAFGSLGGAETATVEALAAQGVRFSIDGADDLRLDPRELTRRGVRFVKVTAARLLDPESARGAAIHPADLSSLLARHGVELIATHVEEERLVPELLDLDVRFAQGELFGVPRPVRPASPEPVPNEPIDPRGPVDAGSGPTRLVPRSAVSR